MDNNERIIHHLLLSLDTAEISLIKHTSLIEDLKERVVKQADAACHFAGKELILKDKQQHLNNLIKALGEENAKLKEELTELKESIEIGCAGYDCMDEYQREIPKLKDLITSKDVEIRTLKRDNKMKTDFRERADEISNHHKDEVAELKKELNQVKEWHEGGKVSFKTLEKASVKVAAELANLQKDYDEFVVSLTDKEDSEDDETFLSFGPLTLSPEKVALANAEEKYVFSSPDEKDESAKESDRRHIVGLTIDNSEED
jgi:chromosome segregation ATPase